MIAALRVTCIGGFERSGGASPPTVIPLPYIMISAEIYDKDELLIISNFRQKEEWGPLEAEGYEDFDCR
jgi:hypothetical protein